MKCDAADKPDVAAGMIIKNTRGDELAAAEV